MGWEGKAGEERRGEKRRRERNGKVGRRGTERKGMGGWGGEVTGEGRIQIMSSHKSRNNNRKKKIINKQYDIEFFSLITPHNYTSQYNTMHLKASLTFTKHYET